MGLPPTISQSSYRRIPGQLINFGSFLSLPFADLFAEFLDLLMNFACGSLRLVRLRLEMRARSSSRKCFSPYSFLRRSGPILLVLKPFVWWKNVERLQNLDVDFRKCNALRDVQQYRGSGRFGNALRRDLLCAPLLSSLLCDAYY